MEQFGAMSKEDLRKMQLIQLEMLIEVDRICRKNNIKYCIIAGTLLGAIRHKGYIPWDDDADIGMLREEYEKFKKVCDKELNKDKFFFQDHSNTPEYRWGYGKLRRNGTVFVRKGQEHLKFKTGVFIDIFPLDGVPDNAIKRGWHNLKCTIVRKLLWSEAGKKSANNFFEKWIYSLLSVIPLNYIFKLHSRLIEKSNKSPSKMVRILTFPTPAKRKYGYLRKWYEELAEIEFEGYKFYAPKDFDEYLTYKFGNYMELPPENERNGHSYTKYDLG